MKKSDLRISFIGAGNIAHSLVSALHNKKYRLVSVISRKKSSAKILADKFSISVNSNQISEIPDNTNLIFISVPDDQIKKVAAEIAKQKFRFEEILVVHLSGIETIEILDSVNRKNGKTASMHLMQTFPGKEIISIKGTPAAIETRSSTANKILTAIAAELGLKFFNIKTGSKPFYHLAGVFASNFLVGNLFSAQQLLSKSGIEKKKYFQIIETTLLTTLKNIKTSYAENSLSGPIERGDIQVIKRHIEVLENDKIQLLSYLIQSLGLLNMIEMQNAGFTRNHSEIRKLLHKRIAEV